MLQLRKERGTDPLYAEAWRWRENLQRAIDGCHTTDEMSSAGLAAYSELKGPNMPLSCGYSVSSSSSHANPMFWQTVDMQAHMKNAQLWKCIARQRNPAQQLCCCRGLRR